MHALVLVPIWPQLLRGLPFTLAGALALAWAYAELAVAERLPQRARVAGLYLGIGAWLVLLPATVLAVAFRITGWHQSFPNLTSGVEMVTAVASGIVTGVLMKHGWRLTASLAVAAGVLLAVQAGPVPITNGRRPVELFISLAAIYALCGVVQAVLTEKLITRAQSYSLPERTETMASWQARCFSFAIRIVVRRRSWGSADALARRARRVFGAPRPHGWLATLGLRHEVVSAGAVRGEWLSVRSPLPGTILYIHGGGFVACSPATHRPITAALARLTQRPVFSVDYRLAPEFPYPAAHDDARAAFDWLVSNGAAPEEVAVMGDSAGGNLALSLAIALREGHQALPACVMAFSPWTDLVGTGDSGQFNDGRDAMFRPDNMADFAAAVLGSAAATEPGPSPLYADLHGLPPVAIHVGSTELLLDDARRTAERIRQAGGVCELTIFEDVPHGWQMLVGFVPEAARSLRSAAEFAERHWSGPMQRARSRL